MSKLAMLLSILAFVFLNLGCEKQREKEVTPSPSPVTQTPTSKESETKEKQIIARINGTPIYKEDLKGRRLNEVIMNEVFYQEGVRQGIDKSVEVKVEEYKKNLVTGILRTEYLKAHPDLKSVSDDEIKRYYDDRLADYTYVRIQEITVKDRKMAEDVMERAKNGEDFEEIAAEVSAPVKTISMRPEKLAKENMFKSTEVGSLSDIVEEGGSYKILKIIDINKYPFEQFKSIILHNVRAQKTSQALQEYMDQIIKDNDINVEILVDKDGK